LVCGSANSVAHGAAAFTLEIARSLRDQAEAAGVPFWLKQGSWKEWWDTDKECGGPDGWYQGYTDKVMQAPDLDGHQHLAAPEPIACILREAGRTP